MVKGNTTTEHNLTLLMVAIISILFSILGTLAALSWAGWLTPPQADRQAMVHDMGSEVMPFSLGQTTHIFEMTESGGVQQVIADDPNDDAQIVLIRQHLQYEAERFRSGDFTDPTSLHGSELPGINKLTAGVTQVSIEYADLPAGAEIVFTTQDLPLITAIHRWFGAQLSDHGADATYR